MMRPVARLSFSLLRRSIAAPGRSYLHDPSLLSTSVSSVGARLAPFSAAAHDPQLEFLTSFAKWQLTEGSTGIKKTFSFKDSWTGERFVLSATDLKAKAHRPFEIKSSSSATAVANTTPGPLGGKNNKGPPMDVDIVIPSEKDSKAVIGSGVIGPEQVAIANAVDDIGATLQLGGGWG